MNIAQSFSAAARMQTGRPAVIESGLHRKNNARGMLTFGALEEQSSRLASALRERGVRAGDRVLVLLYPGVSFAVVIWGLFKLGAVPVLLDTGMGRRSLLENIRRSRPRVIIGNTRALMAQILFRDAFQGIFLTIAADFFPGCLSLAECIASGNSTFQGEDTDAEDLAAILFTSGSTGPAKGVAYTHAMFATQLKWLREVYGLNENGRDFPVFPLFGLFSLALGMTIVVPDMNPSRPAKANPRLMMDSLEHYAATMSFASPAFWKTLTGYALPKSLRLTHLKRVFMAGAPVSGKLIESVYRLLPADAEIHIPYGATESLPLSTLEGRTVLRETWPQTAAGAGTCVGKPLAGVRVKVLRILERPLREWDASLEMPTGAIGEIVVASPVTSKHYVVADEDADLYSKIPDGSVIWHRMGDTGYLDPLGRLWFTGRVRHRVILRETTLYPAVVEGIFNARPEVSRSALVGAKGRPVLIVDLNPGFKPRSARGALLEFAADHDQTRGLRDILFLSRLPVDVRHNVKIDREALAIWAAGRLS